MLIFTSRWQKCFTLCLSFCVSLQGWRATRAGFTCSPPTVAGWGAKGIQGTTPCGGGWACWTGWLKPTQCGCCWQSVRTRPVMYCSDSRQGWGGCGPWTLMLMHLLWTLSKVALYPTQVFLVRKSAALQRKVLSVRLKEDQSGTPISHFPVRESQYSK